MNAMNYQLRFGLREWIVLYKIATVNDKVLQRVPRLATCIKAMGQFILFNG